MPYEPIKKSDVHVHCIYRLTCIAIWPWLTEVGASPVLKGTWIGWLVAMETPNCELPTEAFRNPSVLVPVRAVPPTFPERIPPKGWVPAVGITCGGVVYPILLGVTVLIEDVVKPAGICVCGTALDKGAGIFCPTPATELGPRALTSWFILLACKAASITICAATTAAVGCETVEGRDIPSDTDWGEEKVLGMFVMLVCGSDKDVIVEYGTVETDGVVSKFDMEDIGIWAKVFETDPATREGLVLILCDWLLEVRKLKDCGDIVDDGKLDVKEFNWADDTNWFPASNPGDVIWIGLVTLLPGVTSWEDRLWMELERL